MVLCDAFRHPAVLAREAVSLDHASGGRFELGIGWGSACPEELDVLSASPAHQRRSGCGDFAETLDVDPGAVGRRDGRLRGRDLHLHGASQRPGPLGKIPILIGGAGKGTMRLVAAHADWWNVHTSIVDRLDDMRAFSGNARCSLQVQVAFVPPSGSRQEVEATARLCFGPGPIVGTGPKLVDYFGSLRARLSRARGRVVL